MTERARPMWMFGLLTGLFAAGYGVMFTVLDEFRDEYGIGETRLGWIVAVGFFSAFVAQIAIAPLADRGHARALVYFGLAFNLVGLFGMAWGTSFWVLMAARVLMGIGVGAANPAIRRIVINAEPDHLGRNLGRLLAADVAGFAAGPAISAVLVGPFGIPTPFLVLAVASVAAVALTARVEVEEQVEAPSARFAFDMLRAPQFSAAVLLGGGAFLMIGTFDALWAVVLDDLDAAEWVANLGVTLFAVPFVLFGPRGGRIAERFGAFRWGALGLSGAVVALTGYGLAGSAWVMLAISVGHSMLDGFTISASGVAVGMVAPAERQAAAQGMLGAVQTLIGGGSAILAGWLYESNGQFVAYAVSALAVAAITIAVRVLAGDAWTRAGSAPAAAVVAAG